MTERALEESILDLLARRDPGRTICPSDAARAVYADRRGAEDPEDGWRDLMPAAREAAARLVASGEVVVTQQGEVVDPLEARGPIRIGRAGSSC